MSKGIGYLCMWLGVVWPAVGLAQEAKPPSKPLVRPYGLLKLAAEGAYGAPESFGRANFSAVTSAAHPVSFGGGEAFFTSFQVAQSRFGLKVGEGTGVVGTLEMDFIDFGQSSPTTSSKPRLRVASVDWSFSERSTLSVGQQWDLFAHVQPLHMNLVGAHFTAGNVSFMRDQIKLLHRRQDVEVAVALGLPGANGTESLNNLERGLVPTVAARVSYLPNPKSELGVSGIVTSLRMGDEDRLGVYGAALHMSWVLSERVELRGEGYWGQNLGNIGQLSLAQGSQGQDLRELGGWVSVKHQLSLRHGWTLSVGGAQVLNEDELRLGYVPATMTSGATRALGQGLGARRNVHVRLGWVSMLSQGFKVFVEPYGLWTIYKLTPADAQRVGEGSRSLGAQTGVVYSF